MDEKRDLKEYLELDDIVIKNNTASWELNAIGNIQGLYTGTFVFKCFLTPSEKLAAGRDYREFLGPNAVPGLIPENEDGLAYVISQLKYRIISAPPFWNSAIGLKGISGDLPDDNILDLVFKAALDSELKYLALLEEKRNKAVMKAKNAGEEILNNLDLDNEEENKKSSDKS